MDGVDDKTWDLSSLQCSEEKHEPLVILEEMQALDAETRPRQLKAVVVSWSEVFEMCVIIGGDTE